MQIIINNRILSLSAKEKRIASVLASIVIFLCFSCNEKQATCDIKIVAHRGGTMETPENTMSAFMRANELGVHIIEIDLRTSKDGRLLILHDRTVDRTTNGSGCVSGFTLEGLKKLDAGSWFDPLFAGEKIPDFEEVLQWSYSKDVMLLLDLKESEWDYAEKISSVINEYGNKEKIIIGVRSPDQAIIFSNLIPEAKQLGFISSPHQIRDYTMVGVEVIRLWSSWLEQEPALAEQVREAGAELMINGKLGGIDETRMILSFLPDWILIDDPEQLFESLNILR